jgi:His/Glu/Gln/Arg/opine family amino acid ABC transporter permease subunit
VIESLTVAQATFRWEFIWDNREIFLDGVRLTIFIALIAFTLATFAGLAVALLRMSTNRIIQPIMAAYINIFRAIPLLVFIVFVYYGIAIQFDLSITAIQAGIFALTLQYSAWLGEIFRSGIQAIPHGQREAALSVGMGRVQTFFRVILPQAVRIVIPPTGNMFIGMIKDSSLVYLIGVPELFRVSFRLANRTFRYFEVYLAVVLIYLILTTAVYFGVKYLERRYALVDVLTSKARIWSPFARRKAARLRALQAAVRAAKEEGTTQEDLAGHTADVGSLEFEPPEDMYEEEGSTYP